MLAGVAAAVSVSAQGTLSLSTVAGARPRIQKDGANALPADNIWVQVLVNGTGPDAFALTLGGANAGLFAKGTYAAANVAPGVSADVTIRAWDKNSGADFASAAYKDTATFKVALGGLPDANGIPSLPSGIVGAGLFQGLNVITPEPSTYALAALGLGGLLFLRRK